MEAWLRPSRSFVSNHIVNNTRPGVSDGVGGQQRRGYGGSTQSLSEARITPRLHSRLPTVALRSSHAERCYQVRKRVNRERDYSKTAGGQEGPALPSIWVAHFRQSIRDICRPKPIHQTERSQHS